MQRPRIVLEALPASELLNSDREFYSSIYNIMGSETFSRPNIISNATESKTSSGRSDRMPIQSPTALFSFRRPRRSRRRRTSPRWMRLCSLVQRKSTGHWLPSTESYTGTAQCHPKTSSDTDRGDVLEHPDGHVGGPGPYSTHPVVRAGRQSANSAWVPTSSACRLPTLTPRSPTTTNTSRR